MRMLPLLVIALAAPPAHAETFLPKKDNAIVAVA